MDQMKRAYTLLKDWKGDSYVHGLGVLDQVGPLAAKFGKRALVVSNTTYMKPVADRVVLPMQSPMPPERTSIAWSPTSCIPNPIASSSSAVVRQSMR
jgi:hypothetical protein